jgi:PE family
MSSELRKPEVISWNAAAVELPEVPMLPAGPDAMSSTIAAVLPTLAAQLTANVAALSAKENTFSGKLGAAQTAYQNSDDSGSQSVGQVAGMLGQLGQQAGQMSQQAGAPMQALGGQMGTFGSLMQQTMQGAQGAGGQSVGGQVRAEPPIETREREDAEERQPLQRADDRAWAEASGPERGSNAAPVTSPSRPQRGDGDITRNL